jgi:molybdopterin molybdotransferase
MDRFLSVEEAQQRILEAITPCPNITVPLSNACGHVLGGEIISETDLPPFANSSMDGFAVRAEDVHGASPQNPIRLSIVDDIPAGAQPHATIQNGQTARIMTGAPIPTGADAVIPLEDTNFSIEQAGESTADNVLTYKPVKAGAFIRPKGQDIQKGHQVLAAGRKLMPQDVGLLASLGIVDVTVFKQPTIALISSGDELIPPNAPLEPGKIRDINTSLMAALIKQHDGEVMHLGIVPDDENAVRKRLDQACASGADMILTTAGVSAGAYDYIRMVIQEQGELTFWKVNLRPGKPLAFGNYCGLPIIGLPGNPVSAYVGFQLFVVPVINKMSGYEGVRRRKVRAFITQDIESDGRESYLRAILKTTDGQLSATLSGHQGSGNLFSLVQANALLIIPAGVRSLKTGSEVEAWVLDEQTY